MKKVLKEGGHCESANSTHSAKPHTETMPQRRMAKLGMLQGRRGVHSSLHSLPTPPPLLLLTVCTTLFPPLVVFSLFSSLWKATNVVLDNTWDIVAYQLSATRPSNLNCEPLSPTPAEKSDYRAVRNGRPWWRHMHLRVWRCLFSLRRQRESSLWDA